MWKIVKRCLWTLLLVGVLLFAAEALFFLNVLVRPNHLRPADAIVSFEGNNGRARAAYELAERKFAPVLVISPASDHTLRKYESMFRSKRHFDYIIETEARTTFENALHTGKIIKENGYASVILVTSWNHMPRSYLLSKLMLVGSGVLIQPCNVGTGRLNIENWYNYGVGWKMVYNEMVDTWGSLIECVQYEVSGQLPGLQHRKAGALSWLKKFLLFDIDPKELDGWSFKEPIDSAEQSHLTNRVTP